MSDNKNYKKIIEIIENLVSGGLNGWETELTIKDKKKKVEIDAKVSFKLKTKKLKTNMVKQICENCGKKINVPETALKLCDKCFNEKCECGHKRAIHVDNVGSCVHTYSLSHKTKRGESCPCKKFKLEK